MLIALLALMAIVSVAAFFYSAASILMTYLYWTLWEIKGAGQEVVLVMNPITGTVHQYPHPDKEDKSGIAWIGVLDKVEAIVDTSQDQFDLKVDAASRRAPESTEPENKIKAVLNVAVGVLTWVPRYHEPGRPWSHDGIASAAEERLPQEWYVPGAAALAFLTNYVGKKGKPGGEHYHILDRVLATNFREIIGMIDIADLRNPESRKKVTFVPQAMYGLHARGGRKQYTFRFSSPGELQQRIGYVLRDIANDELLLYGQEIFQVKLRNLGLPPGLVEAYQREIQADNEVARVATYRQQLERDVNGYIRGVPGADPNITALAFSQAAGAEPSLPAWVMALVRLLGQAFRGGRNP